MRARTGGGVHAAGGAVTDVQRPVRMLSGGQRQGVANARAAIWAKTVVLLDEPTAALGVRQRKAVDDLIKTLRRRGFGVLLISHDVPQVLDISDRVTVLRLGQNARNARHRRGRRDLGRDRDGRRGSVTALAVARRAPTSGMFWIFVVLVGLVVAFSLALPGGTFVTTFNAQTIAGDASTLFVLAAGATLVIISGGLDLSVGSVMTFSAVVAALVMKDVGGDAGGHALAAALAGTGVGLASGVAWGAINGWLIAYVRLPPFVVTLGSLGAALGAARLPERRLERERHATRDPGEGRACHGPGHTGPVRDRGCARRGLRGAAGPNQVGRAQLPDRLQRAGGTARRNSGARHLFSLYVLSGLLAACAGSLELSRFAVASVSTGHTTELIAALAAVVIGGASLTGGTGSISATVVGVLIPVVLANGLLIGGVERFWQDVVVGIILVAAVWFDQWRSARETRDL